MKKKKNITKLNIYKRIRICLSNEYLMCNFELLFEEIKTKMLFFKLLCIILKSFFFFFYFFI